MDLVTLLALDGASSLLKMLLEPAYSTVLEAWAVQTGLLEDFRTLKEELQSVQVVLANVEGRPISGFAFNDMLMELHEDARDADNLLDEMEYLRLREHITGTPEVDLSNESLSHRVPVAVHDALRDALHHLPFRIKRRRLQDDEIHEHRHSHTNMDTIESLVEFDRMSMKHRLKDVMVQLQTHRQYLQNVLPNPLPERATHTRSNRVDHRNTTHLETNRHVVGRAELRDEIISKLSVHADNSTSLIVLPIVGVGGVGKTTFARYIYNDARLPNIFHKKMWVCASFRSFDVIQLTREILNQLLDDEGDNNSQSVSLSFLHDQILKRLRENNIANFLLVLDDLWELETDMWNEFVAPFDQYNHNNGSSIIVTTRIPKIARIVEIGGESIREELQKLELKDEILLEYFNHCIYRNGNNKDTIFVELAKKFVPKLKGNPLAAKTVGRLLASNFSTSCWQQYLEKLDIWENGGKQEDIMPSLKLSYEKLHFPVNQCFLYCGLFPNDFEFDSNELVRFWIGLGCLDHNSRNMPQTSSMEEFGYECLVSLVDYGFFEKHSSCGGKVIYYLRGILHELARHISKNECLIFGESEINVNDIPKTISHLSIQTKSIYKRDEYGVIHRNEDFENKLIKLKNILNIEKLQTLMLFGEYDSHFLSAFKDVFKEARGLRVLHFPILSELDDYSEQCLFSKPLHLRYFSLQYHKSFYYHRDELHLPSSLPAYYHLKVIECYAEKTCLPENMCSLLNLRHLVTCEESHASIANVEKLDQLQNLRKFRVREDDKFNIGQLVQLSKLKGSLHIMDLHNVKHIDQVKKLDLNKNKLESLRLSWNHEHTINNSLQEKLLENIKPNMNYLKELHVDGYTASEYFPTWLSSGYLESLSLHNCITWKAICPSYHNLSYLRELRLVGLVSMEKLHLNVPPSMIRSFECLEELEVKDMQNMIELKVHYCVKLKVLKIIECPSIAVLNFLDSSVEDDKYKWFNQLEKLEISSCPELITPMPSLPHTNIMQVLKVEYVGQSAQYERFQYKSTEYLKITGFKTQIIDSKTIAFHNMQKITQLDVKFRAFNVKCSNLEQLSSLKTLHFNGRMSKMEIESLPSSIQDLSISWIDILPSWSHLSHLLEKLPNLSKLHLCYCNDIEGLMIGDPMQTSAFSNDLIPGILHVPRILYKSLRVLKIDHCRIVTYGSLVHLSSLKHLYLRYCPSSFSCKDPASFLLPPSLESMDLAGCNGSVEWFKLAAEAMETPAMTLQTLTIPDVDMLSECICSKLFSSLQSLKLSFDKRLEMFSENHMKCLLSLTSLIEFSIFGCPNLRSLPLALPNSTKSLEIINCRQLESLPEAGLASSLVELTVEGCPNLRSLSLLPNSIKRLEISTCENLGSLPDGLPSSLLKLKFSKCPNLSLLPPLPNSIKSLELRQCTKLELLPDKLPSSLLVLTVLHCTQSMKDQCEKFDIPRLDVM